jgi:hypothetical protein
MQLASQARLEGLKTGEKEEKEGKEKRESRCEPPSPLQC